MSRNKVVNLERWQWQLLPRAHSNLTPLALSPTFSTRLLLLSLVVSHSFWFQNSSGSLIRSSNQHHRRRSLILLASMRLLQQSRKPESLIALLSGSTYPSQWKMKRWVIDNTRSSDFWPLNCRIGILGELTTLRIHSTLRLKMRLEGRQQQSRDTLWVPQHYSMEVIMMLTWILNMYIDRDGQ